jgi:hypothetical protein
MGQNIDFFEDLCFAPIRNVNNKFPTLEALQAEMWIWAYFRNYYKRQYGDSNTFVITGLSYLTQDYRSNSAFKSVEQLSSSIFDGVRKYSEYYLKSMPNSKVFNIILKWLRSDFKNMYSGNKNQDFSKLTGGMRKPDVLGIRFSGNRIIFELLEVTTQGQASKTIVEDLNSKKDILEKGVKPNIEREISDLQMSTGTSVGPTSIEIIYSKWKPDKNQLIIPLLPNLNNQRSVKFEWICYKPTFRYNEGKGQDGLILYEIHSAGTPDMVPKRVLEKIASELRKLMRQHTFELTLTPFLSNYWKENQSDQRELELLIAAGVGIALIIVLAIFLLPEIAAAAAAAAAYTTATTSVISAEIMAAAVGAAAALPRLLSIAERVINSLKPALAY